MADSRKEVDVVIAVTDADSVLVVDAGLIEHLVGRGCDVDKAWKVQNVRVGRKYAHNFPYLFPMQLMVFHRAHICCVSVSVPKLHHIPQVISIAEKANAHYDGTHLGVSEPYARCEGALEV